MSTPMSLSGRVGGAIPKLPETSQIQLLSFFQIKGLGFRAKQRTFQTPPKPADEAGTVDAVPSLSPWIESTTKVSWTQV